MFALVEDRYVAGAEERRKVFFFFFFFSPSGLGWRTYKLRVRKAFLAVRIPDKSRIRFSS